MKKRIAVITGDEYLYQKIYLAVTPEHDCERLFGTRADGYDLSLFDADVGKAPEGARTVAMSRKDGELKIPFSRESLLSAIESTEKAPELTLGDGCAYFKGRRVRLSELELSLLSLLVGAAGELISREEILERVWHSECSIGVINVYIHYLREKLEADGERVILSSHGKGYRIDKKFLEGER